jgi:hypothetical protein
MPRLITPRALRVLLAAALVTSSAPIAHAQSVTTVFAGSTVDKTPEPFNWFRLGSSGASGRRFDVLGFQVAETGSYNLTNTNIGGWDHFFALYIGAFDPSRPEQNNLWWCDTCSPFNITLQAGASYFGVTTGWSTATGDYRLTITGPSTATRLSDVAPPATPPSDPPPVVPVPEPSAVALLLAGSALLMLRARRQARVR